MRVCLFSLLPAERVEFYVACTLLFFDFWRQEFIDRVKFKCVYYFLSCWFFEFRHVKSCILPIEFLNIFFAVMVCKL